MGALFASRRIVVLSAWGTLSFEESCSVVITAGFACAVVGHPSFRAPAEPPFPRRHKHRATRRAGGVKAERSEPEGEALTPTSTVLHKPLDGGRSSGLVEAARSMRRDHSIAGGRRHHETDAAAEVVAVSALRQMPKAWMDGEGEQSRPTRKSTACVLR